MPTYCLDNFFNHIATLVFPCNITITNFLVPHTCQIRFHDVIDRTVHVYMMTSSYAKIPKHGEMSMFWTPFFLI